MYMNLQLQEFFTLSSVKEIYENKKQIYISNIITAVNAICSVVQVENRLLVQKGQKTIVILFDEDAYDLGEDIVIQISIHDDIFYSIQRILSECSRRKKTMVKKEYILDHSTKNILSIFYDENIVKCAKSVLSKRELIGVFKEWIAEKCIQLSSRLLFSFMNEQMGTYKNGWTGYKLFGGITEDDFD